LLRDLDDVAAANKWKETLPKPVLDAITRNGHIYAAPINIHGQNWLWYSKPAFEKAGITEPPANFDDLFADLDKLKAAGLVPLALNGQARHMALIFNAMLLARGGHDLYLKVYRDRDLEAIESPQFRDIVDTYGKLRGYVDAGYSSRLWNDATSMLINNAAGVQFMGDWAKGEFNVAGKKQGVDYGCVVGPGSPNYIIGGDVFIFPKSNDPKQTEAQDLLPRPCSLRKP
jgi:glucose/mannose transport system substrate-binding protein